MILINMICGKWTFENNRWLFSVDNKRGKRCLKANENTRFEDFVPMVIDEYKIEKQIYNMELSYMFPKKVLLTLPQNTPPIEVGNYRQFDGYLEQLKNDPVKLCVELKEIALEEHAFLQKNETNDEDEEDDKRFDYCDDSDGASSGDDDFTLYGIVPDKEETKQDLPSTKVDSISTNDHGKSINSHVKVELSALNLAVGQCYETKDALETRLKILTVLHQFDFKVDRSKPDMFVIKCWVEGCTWRVRATLVGDSTQFTIRVYVDEHSCSNIERSARARQATPDILALLYVDYIGGVDSKVLPKHVGEALNKRFGVKMNYWKAHRTLLCARNLVTGSPESGYSELPRYLYQIRQVNPGTFTRLEVDECNRFKYLFIAFGASINGFPFMRKVIVVDGTFLQGKYKGTLLLATAQDGNFQIYPIAFAIVDTENDESWEWFFRQLSVVIPDDEELAIISDRHKAIGNAIGKVYPKSSRGVCTYHLYKNILGGFNGKEAFRLFKKAANTFRKTDFNTIYDEIKSLDPDLHNYLERVDVRMWARVHFPGQRYNLLTTNIAESINRVISSSRSLPIVRLLDAVRFMMTRWFAERRTHAGATKTILTRGVEKLLEKRVPLSKTLTVQKIDDYHVQVVGGTSLHIVNLTKRKCSCCRFDLEKLPCVHALAAAEARKRSPISYSDRYYYNNYLRVAYSISIRPRDPSTPVPDHVAMKVCLPPVIRTPPGRPKKSRMKSTLEKAIDKKRPRKEHACSKCHQTGHNCKTCKISV